MKTKWNPGYRPGMLGKVRNVEMLYEFSSYPWAEDGRSYIHAHPVGDPAMDRIFECRTGISPVRWGAARVRAYRQGFVDGMSYASSAARKIAQEIAQE